MSERQMIGIRRIGAAAFPRYVVASRDGEFYDGTAWTAERKRALVFADLKTARRICRKLRSDPDVGIWEGSIGFHVLAGKKLSPRAVKALLKYLEAAARIELDPDVPLPKSINTVSILPFLDLTNLQRKGDGVPPPPAPESTESSDSPQDPDSAAGNG